VSTFTRTNHGPAEQQNLLCRDNVEARYELSLAQQLEDLDDIAA